MKQSFTQKIIAILVSAAVVWLAHVATAATIAVNDPGDTTGGRGCTLRDAINAANSDTQQGGCSAGSGADEIVFNLALPSKIILTSNSQLNVDSNLTILGPGAGALTIEGTKIAPSSVFWIQNGTVSISGLTIKNGTDSGIVNFGTLTLTGCTLTGNSDFQQSTGGGLYNDGAATAALFDCTISNNKAPGTSMLGDAGGGIFNNGTMTLTNCTVSGNSASGVGATGGGIENGGVLTIAGSTLNNNSTSGLEAEGGAIFNNGGILTLTDSTLSANSVSGALSLGGGIETDGVTSLTNCTMSGNKASGKGAMGGGILDGAPAGQLTIANTIIAHSTGGDCVSVDAVTDHGHNLTQDPTNNCGLTGGSDISATDPLLLSLAKNGSGTKTMALCTGVGTPKKSCAGTSPAIASAAHSLCAAAPVSNRDQRGWLRGSSTCDIGAYETP